MKIITRLFSLLLVFVTLFCVGCGNISDGGGTDTDTGTGAGTGTDALTTAPATSESPGDNSKPTEYPDGLALTATEDTYIKQESSAAAGAYGILELYTSYSFWDAIPFIRFDISGLTLDRITNYGKVSLQLFVNSVPEDTSFSAELGVYDTALDADLSTLLWSDLTTEDVYTPDNKIASYKITPDSDNTYIRIDITDAVKSHLEAGDRFITLALDDASHRSMRYTFSSLECGNRDNAPTIVLGELPQKLSVNADVSDIKNGKVTVSASARAAGETVTFKMYLYADDGALLDTIEKQAELAFGANKIKLTFDKAEFDGSYIISYVSGGTETEIISAMTEVAMIKKGSLYLDKLEKLNADKTVTQTGINRHSYADVIALCLAEYNKTNNLKTITVGSVDSTLHSYSRVVCSMAVLCQDGDVTAFRKYDSVLYADHAAFVSLFETMMTRACDSIPTYAGKDVLNFSIKELILAYELVKDKTSPTTLEKWSDKLSAVKPTSEYYSHATKTTNRNVYIMGGEQLRAANGLYDTTAFIESSWERQRSHFNDNGMYLDNFSSTPEHNPVLYDLTTRVQLQLVTGCGYDGKYATEMNDVLRAGGFVTLFMQSAAFELSYGGRSNQFIFNEALISSNCEYEAAYYASIGDDYTAGVYKRAAHLAIASISRWLDAGKHLKNFYYDASIGAEGYGNFDKYMATMSSFLAIGYYFADDTIEEELCPAECGGYVVFESENFHIITANVGGYSIEITTDADKHYDSTGLGRIHKFGVPTELALSSSFTATPEYKKDPGAKSVDMSIDAGWISADGSRHYLAAQSGFTSELIVLEESAERVSFRIIYHGGTLKGDITEEYTLTAEGLEISAKIDANSGEKICYTVPALVSSGDMPQALRPETAVNGNILTVTAGEYIYTVEGGTSAELLSDIYANRNGRYKTVLFTSDGVEINMSFSLNS